MKVWFSVGMSIVGCRKEQLVELDDNMTEEEIQEEYVNWVWEQIDGGWEILV